MKFDEIQFKGKKALVRADLNVPIKNGEIADNTRITACLPTVEKILQNGGAVILMSHLGRPQKKRKEDGSIDREQFTLRPVAEEIAKLTGKEVALAEDVAGEDSQKKAANLKAGSILVIENTRFEEGESAGDEALAKRMADMADIYINDAFGTAHREHASTATVARFFSRENKAFGLLMDRELREASRVSSDPKRPYTVILGGAKVSDKIQLIENLLPRANNLLIGGGMAYTFLKAKGGRIGKSILEEDQIPLVKRIMEKAKESGVNIHLPIDVTAASEFSENAQVKTLPANEIEEGFMGLDIGPKTVKSFAEVINGSKTIFWNGPMGVFEMKPFASGTIEVAKAIGEATKNGAYSLIGGGDSVAAVIQFGMQDKMSFLSTGGGAMLTLLEGSELPAIKAMEV